MKNTKPIKVSQFSFAQAPLFSLLYPVAPHLTPVFSFHASFDFGLGSLEPNPKSKLAWKEKTGVTWGATGYNKENKGAWTEVKGNSLVCHYLPSLYHQKLIGHLRFGEL